MQRDIYDCRRSPNSVFRHEDESVDRERGSRRGAVAGAVADVAGFDVERIRRRYLSEEKHRPSSHPDFAAPPPPPPLPPPLHRQHFGRWHLPQGLEPPSTIASPDSPEDIRFAAAAAAHLSKVAAEAAAMAKMHLQPHYAQQRTSPSVGQAYLSNSEVSPHPYSSPYIPTAYHHPYAHRSSQLPHAAAAAARIQQEFSHYHQALQPHMYYSSRGSMAPSTALPASGTRSSTASRSPKADNHLQDLIHKEQQQQQQHSANYPYHSSSSPASTSPTSGSLKQRVLSRPPDLDLSAALERDRQRAHQLQREQQQQQRETWKVPESPRKESTSSSSSRTETNGTPSWRRPPAASSSSASSASPPSSSSASSSSAPPDYPAHFTLGSLIQLSNGDLKRVEDLRTEDFEASAAFSQEVSLEKSEVTQLKASPDQISVTIGFSVGKSKIQVAVEASLEHPFFIIGHGWSSASPQHTLSRYRLPCRQLKVGDICISLVHRSQMDKHNNNDDDDEDVDNKIRTSSGVMGPPPAPRAERESTRSRSSSPAPSTTGKADKPPAQQPPRLSPIKQVVFSDRVTLHSPKSRPKSPDKNGSKIKRESSENVGEHISNLQQHFDVNSSRVKEELSSSENNGEKSHCEISQSSSKKRRLLASNAPSTESTSTSQKRPSTESASTSQKRSNEVDSKNGTT